MKDVLRHEVAQVAFRMDDRKQVTVPLWLKDLGAAIDVMRRRNANADKATPKR